MKMTLKGEDAKKFLKNVEPEWKAFWFHMGAAVKNMREFERELRKSSERTFRHHVTSAKNDFSIWTKDVIGDQMLAESLKAVKTAKEAADKVEKRIAELETAVKKLADAAAKEAKKRSAKK
ncbi:hypothetical protein HY633_02250 [Candidatus Uhrbacteria bacterium]|nr:hypothetical protein [Candidatus Uhrbacteria bacterium]